MMTFARLKLATQLLILVAGATLLVIVLLVILAIVQARTIVQGEIDQRVMALAEASAELAAPPLAARDAAGVERVLMAVVRTDGLDSAFVFNSMGAVVAERFDTALADNLKSFEDTSFAIDALRAGQRLSRIRTGRVEVAVPVVMNGRRVGVLVGQSSFTEAADQIAASIPRMLAAGLGVALLAGLIALAIARYIAVPLGELAAAATAIGHGKLDAAPTIRRGGEIGALASAFGQMVADLRAARAEVAAQQQTLETRVAERTADLEHALAELREAMSEREQLSATVREMSSPVVPVLEGILVMPLIGVIDAERAESLMDALLEAIERHRATIIIMDVTGVPIVDTHVARVLLDAANAASLLGAQTVLVGLRPELAQTIVGLGLDLSRLVTRADLQSGVSYAMQYHARAGRANYSFSKKESDSQTSEV